MKMLAFEEQKKFNAEFLKTMKEIKDCVFNFVENNVKEREDDRKIKIEENNIRKSELDLIIQLTNLNISETIND